MRTFLYSLVFGCAAAGAALAQTTPGPLLDTLRVKIKPEKRMEYEAAVRKIAEVNRKHGDRWIAYVTQFGDTGAYQFTSVREKWADVETGEETFRKAMMEGLGSGMPKFFADLSSISTSMQAEIRRRIPDLSVNIPASQEDRLRQVSQARFMRTIRLELKPGRMPEWVEAWKPWQAELERVEPKVTAAVSATSTGRSAVVISSYFRDMAEMDAIDVGIQKALAGDTYREFMRKSADMLYSSNWEIHRILPELSSMPEEFVSMNPEFWKPKTVATRMKKDALAPKKQ
jgi:hypothetical protein